MEVICIDDSNQPEGANVVKGTAYEIEDQFNNALDQKVFIIKGVNNWGHTKLGMKWIGYKAERFRLVNPIKEVEREYEYAMN